MRFYVVTSDVLIDLYGPIDIFYFTKNVLSLYII